MGEGYGNDAALMNYVTSVNIACGYHAGDAATMRQTVANAIEKGIAIGAHPGYRDLADFGRTPTNLSPQEIFEIVTDQISLLNEIVLVAGGKLRHVKPHGALYNQSATDPKVAAAIAKAVFNFDPKLLLFGLSGSLSIIEAEKIGLKSASEVFADRTYQATGSLTPRTQLNALIDDVGTVLDQALQMVLEQTVTDVNGEMIAIKADTICVHGDGVQALKFAEAISKTYKANDIDVVSISD